MENYETLLYTLLVHSVMRFSMGLPDLHADLRHEFGWEGSHTAVLRAEKPKTDI